MSLALRINNVDRSSIVDWRTLSKTEVLTKEVDRLEFDIKKTTAKTIPSLNDEVVLLENNIRIFGG